MKILFSILIAAAAATQSLLAQTTTVTFPAGSVQTPQVNITVLNGQIFELLTWVGNSTTALKINGIPVPLSTTSAVGRGFFVAGPITVSISSDGVNPGNGIAGNGIDYSALICSYELTTASATAIQNVASQAVVIPENGSANADIIFESSTDLITWTAAAAGSYAPFTAKRFFRVRLVTH